MSKNEIFAENLKNGQYDTEITQILLDWQIANSKGRVEEFTTILDGRYEGERLSVSGLNQNYIDELLHLGRELHQETRRSYLKENLEQYLHDLKYLQAPTIYITESEWETLRNGHGISKFEVLRNWATSTIESIEDISESEDIPTSDNVVEAPKRGRKTKTVEEK